jgi:hypothetical protein
MTWLLAALLGAVVAALCVIIYGMAAMAITIAEHHDSLASIREEAEQDRNHTNGNIIHLNNRIAELAKENRDEQRYRWQ